MPATQIKKIEFDSPITLQENEQLSTVFLNRPEGVVCKCVLIQANGNRVVIGEDLEDVVEDDPVRDSGPVPDEPGKADPNSPAS